MNADPAFEQILDKIPEKDQSSLKNQHGITNLHKLIEMKTQVEQRELDNVCTDVQFALEVVCKYLETLDNYSSFTWEGFENFCGFTDNSGDYIMDPMDDGAKKNKTDPVDTDPEGYNLTAEERKQMEQNIEDDPLTMKIRGFSSRTLQFEDDKHEKKKLVEDASEKTQVAFNGRVYYVKKCYYHQQQNGERVTVGIIKFTKNEKKAICALVVPFSETIMGPHLPEEPPIDVPATYEEDQTGVPMYVAVHESSGSEPVIPLSSLKPCVEPSAMPELWFERQRSDEPPHNFGFVYKNDGSNRGEERDEVSFVDCFAGGGGFHHGLSQVPGLKGVAAVDWWERASETFERNNPETPFYYQKVEDFLGRDPDEFRKKHGITDFFTWSAPCQSFSGSNRDVDHNSEKDLYRKYLSVKIVYAMKVTSAKIGVLENVEGMWRRPNIYFLKKIVLDAIKSGYQVRSRLYRAHVFGDPQARPRLLIFVAKKYVEMPNVIETHGPGKHAFVTAGNALNALEKLIEKNPGLVPNLKGSASSRPDRDDILDLDKPAGTIRCGGRCWHPKHNRAINPREAATLQSFSPTYEFLGTLTDQYKLVGNAVPGRMGAAIGRAVKESLRFVYNEELQEEEPKSDGLGTVSPVLNGDENVEASLSVLEVDNEGKKDEDDDDEGVVTAHTPVLQADDGVDVDGKKQKEAIDVATIRIHNLELDSVVDGKEEQEGQDLGNVINNAGCKIRDVGVEGESSPVREVQNDADDIEEPEHPEGGKTATSPVLVIAEQNDDKKMQVEADHAEIEEKEQEEAPSMKKQGRNSSNASAKDVVYDSTIPAQEVAPTGGTTADGSSIDASVVVAATTAHGPPVAGNHRPAPAPAETGEFEEQGSEEEQSVHPSKKLKAA